MTLNDIHDELATLRAAILEGCTEHTPQDAGLDRRCGPLYLNEDYLVSATSQSLEYYSPIGYCDPELKLTVGDLVIYSFDDAQVLHAVQTLEFNHD